MVSLQICEYHRFMAEHLSSLFSISTVLFLVLVNAAISMGFVAVVEDHLCQMDAVKGLVPIFFPRMETEPLSEISVFRMVEFQSDNG